MPLNQRIYEVAESARQSSYSAIGNKQSSNQPAQPAAPRQESVISTSGVDLNAPIKMGSFTSGATDKAAPMASSVEMAESQQFVPQEEIEEEEVEITVEEVVDE